jgi:hypothetical protein
MGNAESAKDAYEAFSKGDLETLKEGSPRMRSGRPRMSCRSAA